MIDDLQPERLGKLISGSWGRSLTVHECTASTMDDATAAAADGAQDGYVVLADQQTHGRGAHGRHWLSPPSADLYFSVVTRPAVEPASTALVTLATGLGVRDAVASYLPGRTVEVKWPNDIWIGRRKCAGILVESRTLGMQIDSIIIGVGLNVNRMQWPAELEGAATSLRAEGKDNAPFDRGEVLAAVLFRAERWVKRLVEDGPAVVVNALRPSLALLGEQVRWEDGEGRFDGIDQDGAARVRTAAGLRSLHAARIEPLEHRARCLPAHRVRTKNDPMTQASELGWLEHSVGVLALRDRAIISVTGDDARDWLQGQITNQLEGVEAGSSVYAFVLTLKGRILGDVYVLVRNGEVWLDVPASQVDALLERFDRYIIMEDVDLEHRKDLNVVAAQGPRSDELEDGGWPADRLGVGGRQWIVTHAQVESKLEHLAARCRELDGGEVSEAGWAHAHIVRGRPRFGVDFGDWTYPQESGLNPIAVSFKKGCYIGQETVVMLENRGKAPKVLWRWEIEGPEAPAAKSPIMMKDVVVGEITSAASTDQIALGLGFLKRGHESEGPEGFTIGGAVARALGPVEHGPGVHRPRG